MYLFISVWIIKRTQIPTWKQTIGNPSKETPALLSNSTQSNPAWDRVSGTNTDTTMKGMISRKMRGKDGQVAPWRTWAASGKSCSSKDGGGQAEPGFGTGCLVSSALGLLSAARNAPLIQGYSLKSPSTTSHSKARLQNNTQWSLPELLIHIKLMGSDTSAERFPRSKGNCSSK